MRKVLSSFLTFLSILGLVPSTGMADGMSCEEVFETPGIILSTGLFTYHGDISPVNQAEAVLNLLKMTTSTLGESFSKKLTLEKGELYLGQPLKSGWSLEYEYASDNRSMFPAFRLTKISIVKPNGEKNAFEKKPTSLDGLSLAKSRYSVDDMGIKDLGDASPFDSVQHVEAPVVIEGKLLKDFLKFAPLASYLKKEEINSADNVRMLFLKAMGRSNADFMKGVIKKQAFKYVLLGVVLYGYYSEQDLVKSLIHHKNSDSWSVIKEKTDTTVMMDIISSYLRIGKKSAKAPPSAPVKIAGSQASMDETIQQVAGVMKAETAAGGKVQMYVLNEKGAKSVSIEQLLGGKDISASGESALLVSLSKSHRLMLIQPGENKQVITYGLDNVTSPNEYGAVKWAIDHTAE